MTETVTGAPARNYIGGEWRESAGGATYEKRSPWRPSDVTGVYPASTAEDARAAIRLRARRSPRGRRFRQDSAPRSLRRRPRRSRHARSRSHRT